MGQSKYFYTSKKKVPRNNYYLLVHEKSELESHYDFLSCRIRNKNGTRELVVKGSYDQTGVKYIYEVVYNGIHAPKVRILCPPLVPNPPHTYEDGSLCLFYPTEQPWLCTKSSLYSHIIPWTHEWILYYEIYLINGKWEHPEVIHNIKNKHN